MKIAASNTKLISKAKNQTVESTQGSTTGLKFYAEKQNSSDTYYDLHLKFEDEPDFDCEFLNTASEDYYNHESIIDLDTDEDFTDDYHDNIWDENTYDPYLESTNY